MRFSLKSLLVFTGLIAVLCGIFFAIPDSIAVFILGVMTVAFMPAAAVTAIVYSRGKARAFAIGALASMGWMGSALMFAPYMMAGVFSQVDAESGGSIKVLIAIVYSITASCGGLGVLIRWLCLRGASAPAAATPQPSPALVLFDPRDKAELYAILQGRMAVSNVDGDFEFQPSEKSRMDHSNGHSTVE